MPGKIQVPVSKDAFRTVGGGWFLTLLTPLFIPLPAHQRSLAQPCTGSFNIPHPHTRSVLVHLVLVGIPAFQLLPGSSHEVVTLRLA